MKVKDGKYRGSLCTLLVKGNSVTVTVDDEQLDLLKFYKNYDFGFDDEGNLTGTGARTPACSGL